MSWERELRALKDAIRNAGGEAARLSADGFDIRTKADESPVNAILHERLLSAFPEDGWLSEESPDSAARLNKRRVWIIDPIDGTKAFIRKEPEYCVSVALVEEGRPVVAAIYNPATEELFTAVRGGGLRLNDEPVRANGRPTDARPVIAVSPWEQHLGRFKTIEPHAASRPMRSIAWALALLAGGRLHAVATFEPENEWDVAAGALLIEEAGGTTQDGAWHTLGFNRPEPRYRGIIAVSRHCPPSVTRRLRALSPA
jgi:myo-inositol-1(or 4)-monophosphatase